MSKKSRIKEYHAPAGGWGAAKATAAALLEQQVLFKGCPSSNLNPHGFIGRFARLAIASFMATPTSETVPVARNEPRTHTALLLEAIALRH
jgi:hypothetical protein